MGYVQADINDDEAMLEDIAIAKKYQGKGIGKRLLRRELKALGRKGVKTILAEVHCKCAASIPFIMGLIFG
jgi:ribosomal protein S18 acetylase RimI-like enzyme